MSQAVGMSPTLSAIFWLLEQVESVAETVGERNPSIVDWLFS